MSKAECERLSNEAMRSDARAVDLNSRRKAKMAHVRAARTCKECGLLELAAQHQARVEHYKKMGY